jgi:hypothetical protein
LTDAEILDEIKRLQKAINKADITVLHDRIMNLIGFNSLSKTHVLEPLTRQEFDELFRLCNYEAPEITDIGLKEFNEIHRIGYNPRANENMTFEEVDSEIKRLMKVINWK